MKLVERFWTTLTVVVNWFTLSPFYLSDDPRFAITPKIDTIHTAENIRIQNLYNIDPALEYEISSHGHGPKFRPPTGRPKGLPGSDLKCEYPSLGPDWIPCSTAANRECWLKNTKTGKQYNITTDYEKERPPGIVRDYTLVLSNTTINADGIEFPYAKVFSNDFPEGEYFNGTFPGPWIQACWGDTLNVTVYNMLPYTGVNSNGTSIHWHGLRQLDTMQFDGVNGITQCPIAPDDHFTYTFPVMQYGSTWYHSHYSMQYADGTQGPLTLHGPTSAPFDHPLYPLIMTDWGHNSAFEATYPTIGLLHPSIVLNGRGNITRFSGGNVINTTATPDTYHVTFEPGKRYLMRIINTAFRTGFRFSIDGHKFEVVQNDLVPIEPYTTNSIVVHIGQRYNIVVQAKEKSEIGDGNFWIRTTTCYSGSIQHGPGNDWMKTGIVRYDNQSTDDPTDRTSIPWPFSQICDDEPLGNIHPKHKWTIGPSKNSVTQGENIAVGSTSKPPYIHAGYLWKIKETDSSSVENFQIQYNDPIFLRLADPKPRPQEVVIFSSENYTANDWAYIVIADAGGHPIHLHGHDFAVVFQSDKSYSPDDIKSTCPDNRDFQCDNPPRRDVIMPHDKTYVVIAFKTDNPGSWLLHCHIASHAGAGLDLQVLERSEEAAAKWPPGSSAFVEAQRVCYNWEKWWDNIKIVQDDSGV